MSCGRVLRVLGGCLCLLVPRPAEAQEVLPSYQGFTGLWNTPNAWVTPDGAADLAHNDQIDPRGRRTKDWSAVDFFSVGIFPYLEGGLRLSNAGTHGVAYTGSDLSANVKLQIPFLPDWLPRLALGAQDLGGGFKASSLRSKYVVASQNLGPLRLSLGGGSGPDRMKGVFGGAEWQVAPWLQVVADRDHVDTSLGLKLLTPRGFLPGALVAGGFLKRTLNETYYKRLDAGFFLRLPLGGGRASAGPAAPAQSRTVVPARTMAAATSPPEPKASPYGSGLPGASWPPVKAAAPLPREATSSLTEITATLARLGFENVRTGTRGRTLVVEFENNRFNHSELDGLGLLLGKVVVAAPEAFQSFLVVLKKRKLRLLEVEGPMASVRAAFTNPATHALLHLLRIRATGSFEGPVGVEWSGPEVNSSSLHSSLILAPGLDTRVGTEFGAFDYRLYLVPETLTTLWQGAALNVAWELPVAHSENFGPGKAFPLAENQASLNRAWLSQALPLGQGLMTQFSGGIYNGVVNGVLNESYWSPGNGVHRFGVEAGHFSSSSSANRNVLLGSYRRFIPRLDASLEATAGRFYNQDNGFLISLKRNFRDTNLEVYFSRTSDHGLTNQLLGIRLALPLGPRNDLKPGVLQVRGSERWRYGLTSTIHDASGGNPLIAGKAMVPSATTSLERSLYSSDRLSEAYILEHLDRLQGAYALWKDL